MAIESDDVFALGSVLYFIMVRTEPYVDLEEEEVHVVSESKVPECRPTRMWKDYLGLLGRKRIYCRGSSGCLEWPRVGGRH